MDPEAAAALLGVPEDAAPIDVERAWRRRSRDSHPDRFSDVAQKAQAAEEFIRVTRARDILLARRMPTSAPVDGSPEEWVIVPRPRWRLIALWAALALVGIFVATFGEPLPFTVADPILRYGLLVAGLVAYAATGRTPFLVLVVLAVAATALHAVLFTTFGTLLGMFLLGAPVIALVTIGHQVATRGQRREAAAR